MSETTTSDRRDSPQPPRIETLRTKHGAISFSPERGGIITGIELPDAHGTLREILYMDQSTFEDRGKNVKGGIPVLFPNAGPIDNPKYPGMKQHGFARTTSDWESGMSENEFWERLNSDWDSMPQYPYRFLLEMRGRIQETGGVSLEQSVTNQETLLDLPVAMGLHPYFRVPADRKKDMRFEFAGGEKIEHGLEEWSNDGTISIDNPAVHTPDAKMRIVVPELGVLNIAASPEYKKVWVWSMKGKDFVCIEPVMRDEGGLVDDPEMVAPGETLRGQVTFSLETE